MNEKNFKNIKLVLMFVVMLVSLIVPLFQATFFVTVKSTLLNLVVEGLDFFENARFSETRDIPALLSLSALIINTLIIVFNFKSMNSDKKNFFLCITNLVVLILLEVILKKYTYELVGASFGYYLLVILTIMLATTFYIDSNQKIKDNIFKLKNDISYNESIEDESNILKNSDNIDEDN